MKIRAAAALLTALALFSPSLASAAATDDDDGGYGGYREVVYAITLDGQPVAEGTIVLQASGGRFALSALDLQKWGVVLPKVAPLIVDGKPYYPLEDLAGAKVTVEVAAQQLDLNLPSALFETTSLNALGTGPTSLATFVPGYYLNYDAHVETGLGSTSNLLLDAGTQLGQGVIDASALAGQIGQYGVFGVPYGASSNSQDFQVQRLSTQWRYDDVHNNTTFTVGDSVTGESVFADQTHFIGIGFGRNFTIQPWLSTVPLPSIAGTAAVPSLLQVYVNNVLAYNQQIDQGPFRVTNLPNVNGLGQVQMVLRNVQGQQQLVTGSYYTSNDLLAKGLSDFSYDAGFVNYNYGLAGAYYGEFAATATQRYGFSDTFTGDAFAQYAAHDAALGAGANSIIGRIGVLGLGAAVGTSAQGGGGELVANYDYSSPHFGIGFEGKFASTNFILAGDLTNGFQRELLAHANVQFAKTALGLSYGEGYAYYNYGYYNGAFYPIPPNANTTPIYSRVSTVTFNQTLGPVNYIQVLASHVSGTTVTSTVNAALFWLIGAGTRASAFVQSIDGATGPGASITHSTPTLGAVNYDAEVATGQQGYATASAQQFGSHGILAAAFSTGTGGTAAAADVAGALINVNGHEFMTQPIQSAYGAVLVDGYPDVPVFAVNQPVGATDKAGYAALPLLDAYSESRVSIDPNALPLAANVEQASQSTRPRYRLPVLVHFTTQSSGGFVLHLVGSDGKALIPGTTVLDPSGHEWPVGNDGVVYVGGLKGGATTFTARARAATCGFTVTIPQNTSDVPDLGTAVCSFKPSASTLPSDEESSLQDDSPPQR